VRWFVASPIVFVSLSPTHPRTHAGNERRYQSVPKRQRGVEDMGELAEWERQTKMAAAIVTQSSITRNTAASVSSGRKSSAAAAVARGCLDFLSSWSGEVVAGSWVSAVVLVWLFFLEEEVEGGCLVPDGRWRSVDGSRRSISSEGGGCGLSVLGSVGIGLDRRGNERAYWVRVWAMRAREEQQPNDRGWGRKREMTWPHAGCHWQSVMMAESDVGGCSRNVPFM